VARADRRSVRSARTHAVPTARQRKREQAAVEDTLFFTRLRSHAKWMFVFLALVFGLGFVIFGIGSDQGTGIGDILRDGGGATDGGVSLSEAREQVKENPKNPEAQRNLATALQQEGETVEAIAALNSYVALEPKDANALRELAGLHLARGTAAATEAQQAQVRASYFTFGDTFGTGLELGEGQTLGSDPIDEAVQSRWNQVITEAYTRAQQSFQAAVTTYEKLVTVAPNDPNVQLELAQAAQQSGNYDRAIKAYETFLKLAPDDPSAQIVKQQITQLKAAQTQAPPG
jgi:tetratricopeptide (TPR) repeat protein